MSARPPRLAALTAILGLGVALAGCGGSSSSSGAAPEPGAPQGGAGGGAAAYLSSQTYTSLVVEVDYVQGHAPDATALALFEQRLNERLNKPAGISVVLGDAIASVTSRYSVAQLQALEQQHRSTAHQPPQASLYLLYVDGGSDQDGPNGDVLGLAYGESSLALFKETIVGAGTAIVTPSEVEGTVLVHELGHALGLVNLGTPMVQPHEDAAHRGHDVDDRCVMYWAIETTNIRNLILNRGTLPTQFCAAGIADLQAAGGK